VFRKTFITLLSVVTAADLARAEIMLEEHFSYSNGPLVRVSSGTWKTHSGTAGQIVVTDGQIRLSQRKSEDVSTFFLSGPVGSTRAAAIYASFTFSFGILPSGPNGTYFAHFRDATTTTGVRCRIFATTNSAPTGQFRLGISAAANTASSDFSPDLSLGVSYRAVCRMLLVESTSTLWINPQSEADPGLTSTDSASPKIAAGFAFRESMAGGAGMGELIVDDLMIATSFAELAPTVPASLILSIERGGPNTVQLRWTGVSDRSYSVWAADSSAGEFWLLASGLAFGDGQGQFTDDCQQPMRFYRISAD
jgi:hypothetical protein